MSTLIDVAEGAADSEHQQRTPLLHHPSSPSPPQREPRDEAEPEITPSTSPGDGRDTRSVSSDQRLASLDVFRGLTVALMILVDDAGGAFPAINHSPWFGVTLADFVMPFFLFGVGVSVGLVFKKISSKSLATRKVVTRTVKLFLLGLLLQGGYFHGRNQLTYGVDVGKIRWLGVLQRISIGYFLASISEIWLVRNISVDSTLAFVRKYYIQWIMAILLCALYLCMVYGLYVPDWEYQAVRMSFSSNQSLQNVYCKTRGSLEPPCNSVGFVDRYLLGESHLYQHPVYRRSKECSVNSPDYGPLPPNSPGWCLAPFDPEGVLSSLMAAVTCFVGLQYGHILVHVKSRGQRILFWSMFSLPLLMSGYVLELLGIPLCKPLYTVSYMCITAGVSGLLLTLVFYLVDVKHWRMPTVFLQWMGMNALIIYALGACELFPAAMQGFYWRSPENNLVDSTERLLQAAFHSKKWGTLVFVMLEMLFWGCVAGFLHMKRLYVRL
ncbi:heparan-alpha-glucosaminide N-acetyltransferase-like [Rhodamnia argentea]|uniref:Heparan-alpha-glucosaminide N-acetyltransferase-like n=1 Tax=Rhodamnia argentea TaxID=178133 RepID=A0A8B8PD42_9MYRT|nr:heparan-alpha-glucosaminide N-acetyltransferase-like [Rhodamnia argentea]